MKKQFTFIESMIKVGVIGFGGGNALIPVLEQEVVNEKKLVSKDEYDKSVIAATLTPGAKNYLGDKSPNEKERERYGFSRAWLHHQGRNKHHFEYWVDYNPKLNRKEPVEMPTRYLIEMFCDRVAASKIYYGDDYDIEKPFLYFDKGRKRRWMHPVTSQKLEDLLIMLRDRGEKETFSYIKHVMKPEGKKDKAHWK